MRRSQRLQQRARTEGCRESRVSIKAKILESYQLKLDFCGRFTEGNSVEPV